MHASVALSAPQFHRADALYSRSLSRPRPVTLHMPDTEIYAPGDRSGNLYRIEFGAVRIYRLLRDGRRQIVAFYIPGETFGFDAQDARSFFAECIIATGLSTVNLGREGLYSGEIMNLALKEMIRAQEHLLVIGRQSAVEKLAVFLLDLADRQGNMEAIDIPMTRTDIGDYLGMTIETASRNLSKLKSDGILKLHSSRSIEILRPDILRRLSR